MRLGCTGAPGKSRARNALAILLAGLVVLIAPAFAYAATSYYVSNELLNKNVLRASPVRSAGLTGGGAAVYTGTPTMWSVIQTRSGTNYSVLASATTNYGAMANLHHSNISNTWSTCYWHETRPTSVSKLKVDCFRKW